MLWDLLGRSTVKNINFEFHKTFVLIALQELEDQALECFTDVRWVLSGVVIW